MTERYTPGPHTIGAPGGPSGPFWSLVNGSGVVVAMQITSEANARLLAASVDLYEAMVALYAIRDLGDYVYDIRDREGLGWDGPQVTAWNDACMKAQAAMATVRGEVKPS